MEENIEREGFPNSIRSSNLMADKRPSTRSQKVNEMNMATSNFSKEDILNGHYDDTNLMRSTFVEEGNHGRNARARQENSTNSTSTKSGCSLVTWGHSIPSSELDNPFRYTF